MRKLTLGRETIRSLDPKVMRTAVRGLSDEVCNNAYEDNYGGGTLTSGCTGGGSCINPNVVVVDSVGATCYCPVSG